MPKRLYRCMSCEDKPGMPGHDFEGDEPVCDLCQLDQRTPIGAKLIVNRVVIHFDPPSGKRGVGKGVIACTGKPLIEGGFRGTGEPNLVTCPNCKKTDVWIEANTQNSHDPSLDIPDEPIVVSA